MKKGLVGLVILGAIAGTVAYKLKKNQQEKELLDEELEILSGVETEENSETTEESTEEESEEPDEIEPQDIEELKESIEETEEVFEVEETNEIEEDEEITEYDFSKKIEEVFEETQVIEETTKYDFSDAFEDVSEEIEGNSVEEVISEEIIENSFVETNDDIEELDERPIQHTIDFKSVEDMEAYKQVVIEKGYVVTRGESPYQLSVLHIAPNNKSELLVNVYYLANQAVKHNGSYQGWQSRKVL